MTGLSRTPSRESRRAATATIPNAAALVGRRDRHLRQLEAPFGDAQHRGRPDGRAVLDREEDRAASRDDRGLGIVEDLQVGRLHLEQPLDPVEVEPAEIGGELAPDAGDVEMSGGLVLASVAQEVPPDPRPAVDFVLDGDAELRAVERSLAAAEVISHIGARPLARLSTLAAQAGLLP